MIKIDPNNFVVYFHINPIKQEIFNVGLGSPKRPFSKNGRSYWWKNIVNKYGYSVYIAHVGLSLKEACELETKYIKQIGRADLGLGPLVNLTDGGEGSYGFLHTEETKKKLRKPKTVEQKHKLSIASTKYWETALDKHRQENRLNQIGRKNILQKNIDGVLLKKWDSLREIEKHLGFFRFNIRSCLKKLTKQAYNFIWEYE